MLTDFTMAQIEAGLVRVPDLLKVLARELAG
jgi:hypothetical protein